MAMSFASLTTLPEEVLHEIVWYLGCKDMANLASTCHDLLFLRPRKEIVKGENFTLTQEKVSLGEPGPDPEAYMDVPVLGRGLTAVKMSFRWRTTYPRGYVHCAEMWLRLMRDGEVIEETRRGRFDLSNPRYLFSSLSV